MKMSGKYVNEYNWWKVTKSTTEEDAVTKITANCGDAEKAPCDECGNKTFELFPVRTGSLSGTPWDEHVYLCGDCV